MPPRSGPLPRNRVLAGPFDGHLNHTALRNLFLPYGKVLCGVYDDLSCLYGSRPLLIHRLKANYHLPKDPPRTYGFVEFETEAEAKNAIECLKKGSFLSHGKDLRMINVAAVGKLPGHLHEWVYNLSRGFRDYTTIAEADDKDKAVDSLPADVNKGNKGKAAESPSRVKDDSKNVDTSNKGKAVAVPSHGKDDDSKDVGKGDKDKAVVPTNPFETKWNSNIDTADKKSKVMKPVPLFPAHHHPASGDAPDKDQPAIAPKKA